MHTLSVNDKDVCKLNDNQLHKLFVALNGIADGAHDWRDYAYEPPTPEEIAAQEAAIEAARLRAEAEEAIRQEELRRARKAELEAQLAQVEAEPVAAVDPKVVEKAEKTAAEAEQKAKKARGDKVTNA